MTIIRFLDFTLKNCLFGTTNMIKNSAKSKYILSGYGITFDGAGEWSFDDDFAKIVVIFSVNNSSSIHTNNHKK